MNIVTKLIFSIIFAGVFTVLAYLFSPGVGEALAILGFLAQTGANLIIVVLSRNDEPLYFNNRAIFSFGIYFIFAFLIMTFIRSKEK